MARPGAQHGHFTNMAANMAAANQNESYLLSPHTTPQAQQRFDASAFNCMNGQQQGAIMMSFNGYNGSGNVMATKHNMFAANMAQPADFELYPESGLSTPTYVHHQDNAASHGWVSDGDDPRSRRSTRRISDSMQQKIAVFESTGGMRVGAQGPITPPLQNGPCKYHGLSRRALSGRLRCADGR